MQRDRAGGRTANFTFWWCEPEALTLATRDFGPHCPPPVLTSVLTPSPVFSIPFLFFIQLTLPPLEFNSSHLSIILLWLPNSCIISCIYMSVLPWQSLSPFMLLCNVNMPSGHLKILLKMQILLQKSWSEAWESPCLANDAKTAVSGRILQVLIVTIYSISCRKSDTF